MTLVYDGRWLRIGRKNEILSSGNDCGCHSRILPRLSRGRYGEGGKIFKKCKACHAIEEAKNKVGPHLVGIIGRPAASVEDFKYSPAMKAKGEEGLVWDEASLDEYLTKPKKFIPKTKMVFPGLKKEEQRGDLITYLKQFSGEGE